jgi:hypothetical protein
MPEPLVTAIVVSLFSSVIVLFLTDYTQGLEGIRRFSRRLPVAISRFDIEMLLWGGYPNV